MWKWCLQHTLSCDPVESFKMRRNTSFSSALRWLTVPQGLFAVWPPHEGFVHVLENHQILFKKYFFTYLAVLGLSCGTRNLYCSTQDLFSCGVCDIVPWPGVIPGPPALGLWSLSHWTTGEVPKHQKSWTSSYPWIWPNSAAQNHTDGTLDTFQEVPWWRRKGRTPGVLVQIP